MKKIICSILIIIVFVMIIILNFIPVAQSKNNDYKFYISKIEIKPQNLKGVNNLNFSFKHNFYNCLKIKSFKILYNNKEQEFVSTLPCYLPENIYSTFKPAYDKKIQFKNNKQIKINLNSYAYVNSNKIIENLFTKNTYFNVGIITHSQSFNIKNLNFNNYFKITLKIHYTYN